MDSVRNQPNRILRVLAPVVGALALAGLGTAALAAPPGGPQDKGGPCARLQCTDDQKTEVKALFSELRDDTKADREAIAALRKELAGEWVKDSPDEDALVRIEGKIKGHRDAIATMVHDTMMDLHAILTPAQREKLAQALEHAGFDRLLRAGHKHDRGGKKKKN